MVPPRYTVFELVSILTSVTGHLIALLQDNDEKSSAAKSTDPVKNLKSIVLVLDRISVRNLHHFDT